MVMLIVFSKIDKTVLRLNLGLLSHYITARQCMVKICHFANNMKHLFLPSVGQGYSKVREKLPGRVYLLTFLSCDSIVKLSIGPF